MSVARGGYDVDWRIAAPDQKDPGPWGDGLADPLGWVIQKGILFFWNGVGELRVFVDWSTLNGARRPYENDCAGRARSQEVQR